MKKNIICIFLALDFTIGYRNKATTRDVKCGSLIIFVSKEKDLTVDHYVLIQTPLSLVLYQTCFMYCPFPVLGLL